MIDETLSPTWDELLVFEEVLVYGRREDIKTNPPTVIIEIYDQDKVKTTQLSFMFAYRVSKIKFCKSKGLFLGNEAFLTPSW